MNNVLFNNALMKIYNEKLTTAEEAVRSVKSGDWVDYGFFNGKPVACDKALAARKDELRDILITAAVTLPPIPEVVLKDPRGEVFTYCDWHFSPVSRIMQEKRPNVFYNPILFGECESYFEIKAGNPQKIGTDYRQVFIVQTAPMDENGYFNVGMNNAISHIQAATAETVIVEVNPKIPVCPGGARESIHISRVTHIVEGDAPDLAELPASTPTEIDRKNSRPCHRTSSRWMLYSARNRIDAECSGRDDQ